MDYKELTIRLFPRDPYADILMAFLGELGFESFVENDDGFMAYIQNSNYPPFIEWPNIIKEQRVKLFSAAETIPGRNWNLEWESNFIPVVIENKCLVKASFHHVENKYPYEIIIDPKMSFGTAHHETTYMMMALMMEYDMDKKAILDIGSGTGVLAILAEKLGAKSIKAVDNDPWCFENAKENIINNKCRNTEALLGNAESVAGGSYDIVLANINRNILLDDMPRYSDMLKPGGMLFMSGFYEKDKRIIISKAETLGIYIFGQMERNLWSAVVLKKQT